MAIYYLMTRPETVVSVIKTGKLPHNLPDWAHVDYLFCVKTIADCFSGNTTSLHQLFLLELEFSAQEEQSDDFMILESLNIDCIQQIFVYSSQGNNLLKRLLGGTCPKPVVIRPEIYPTTPKQSLKRPPSIFFKEKPESNATRNEKKIKTELPLPSPIFSTTAPNKKEKSHKPIISRLSTYDEHVQLLQSAFQEARKSILITSFSIHHETLERAKLYQLIPMAVARGVRVYFYYNDQQIVEQRIVNFFKENKVFCADTYTHSKILAIDNHLVAAGSFNWLSAINAHYEDNEEGSLCIRSEAVCSLLIEDFWKHIKYYRNEQFGNDKVVRRFERNSHNMDALTYDLDSKTELSYLPTLDEHSGFLQECFERAKHRIIICSPFISAVKEYKVDIDHQLLKEAISRNVDIYFVCSGESPYLQAFRHFLDKLYSPKIHLILIPHIHLKTIIVDEDTIAEGSFNWLSATRDRESDYHNHEQTLLVQGDRAGELIEHFFKTRVGEAILNDMCREINMQTALPRLFV